MDAVSFIRVRIASLEDLRQELSIEALTHDQDSHEYAVLTEELNKIEGRIHLLQQDLEAERAAA